MGEQLCCRCYERYFYHGGGQATCKCRRCAVQAVERPAPSSSVLQAYFRAAGRFGCRLQAIYKIADSIPSTLKIRLRGTAADIMTDMLCLMVRSDSERLGVADLTPVGEELPDGYADAMDTFMKQKVNFGQMRSTYTLGMLPADRVLLVGLGDEAMPDSIRFMVGKIALEARASRVSDFSVALPKGLGAGFLDAISEAVEGAKLSLYSFDKFKSKKQGADPDMNILAEASAENSSALRSAEIVSDGVILARNLANMPPNECAPADLAAAARSVARRDGLKIRTVAGSGLVRGGFGGISAVGQGSRNEPRLIILEYPGGENGRRPTVLVGKAVTFDTGGISIKPGEKMDEMKFDKCGGCAVLGIMSAASRLKLPVNLVGIIPSVENMPGGSSYRPGDIVKLYGGKTAEIVNTDAEGRLILADAMAYGERRYSPEAIIDLATLTGACVVALGANVAGMVSNDDELADRLNHASSRTSEAVWRLPLNDDYMEMIKSEVADMKNLAAGRAAGAIAAAAFLRNAIEKTPWVHLDIAGVARTQTTTKEKPYNPKGATGFGVRLLLDHLSQ